MPDATPGERRPVTPAEEDALADIFAARVADLGLNDVNPERDEHRPLDDPWMPLRTCYWSAWALAQVYPELVVVYGELVLIHNGDVVARTSHAWNTRADGAIIDATTAALSFPSAIAVVYVP
jgi:hypothetical protein